MTVREFADQICVRARDVDPDLIGTGLQRMDADGMHFAQLPLKIRSFLELSRCLLRSR